MGHKLNKEDFDNSDEQTRSNVVQAYIKTVQHCMDAGFGYSYSCSVAASQSLFQKSVIMSICKNELSLVKMRDDYKRIKIKHRQKFDQGCELSPEGLEMFNNLHKEKS